ncbi:hypothetical protein COU76_04285 [Candidatus Peregrinibacteria bacterium CG10_big_fil_rev_8_21_14_0_10_49_10]|nr:MAG: hypothetical protein COU76_04285 [Candidatus Peregrinibacteria bacterium CG10_big_fil_rev_8_21_14_0_10_49_10]
MIPGMRQVLFLTRKRRGRGGMQQYTQDLWVSLQLLYGSDAKLLGPRTRSGFLLFPILAVLQSIFVARKGGIIHIGDMGLSPLARLIRWLVPNARITATAFGLDVVYPKSWYQWLLRHSAPALDRIACISNATAVALQERGVPATHLVVIPCGIKAEEKSSLQPSASVKNGPHLLSIGRLIPRKGIVWFLTAVLPTLLEEYPALTYTVVGTGKMERLIKKLVHNKGLDTAVFLKENLSDAERNQLLLTSDVLVVPNIPIQGDMEGFGIVCIEATSRGLPVIASRIEGLQDAILEGQTGLFFRPEDPEDCLRAVHVLLRHPFGRASVIRTTYEHYDWDMLIQRYHHELFSTL